MQTQQKQVKIQNVRGLHARATAEFVKLSDTFSGDVYVTNEQGLRVNGKSIMGLLMLGAAMGTTLTIETIGDSCDEMLEKLVNLVNNKFGEDV